MGTVCSGWCAVLDLSPELWDLCSSSRVTIGLLAASLINALLARPVGLGGRPWLGRFAVVPYSLHFQLMDWTMALQNSCIYTDNKLHTSGLYLLIRWFILGFRNKGDWIKIHTTLFVFFFVKEFSHYISLSFHSSVMRYFLFPLLKSLYSLTFRFVFLMW